MKHFIKRSCFHSNEVQIRYLLAEIAQLVCDWLRGPRSSLVVTRFVSTGTKASFRGSKATGV
jgi:hypothetical protein